MGSRNTILLIEDDIDDKNIFEMVLEDLEISNDFVWCKNAEEAYDYLCKPEVKMFIIFCDINLPGKSGLEFKKEIDAAVDKDAKWKEKEAEYANLFANPYSAAERGFIDEVILPKDTRRKLIKAFAMLKDKKVDRPKRKHGNIPL